MYSKFSIFNQGRKSVREHGEGQRLEFVCATAVIPCLLWYSKLGLCIRHKYSQLTAMFWDASIFSLSGREHLYSPAASLLMAFKV